MENEAKNLDAHRDIYPVEHPLITRALLFSRYSLAAGMGLWISLGYGNRQTYLRLHIHKEVGRPFIQFITRSKVKLEEYLWDLNGQTLYCLEKFQIRTLKTKPCLTNGSLVLFR